MLITRETKNVFRKLSLQSIYLSTCLCWDSFHWASTRDRAELNDFRKPKLHVKTIPRWKNYFLKKWNTRDLYRHFSLMLIFMSWSCMSLIYLLLIFRGIFFTFYFVNKFFFWFHVLFVFVYWMLRMLCMLMFDECCMQTEGKLR